MGTYTLEHAQELLDQDGVKDVKFLFKWEALSLPTSDLEDDLADVLGKFRAGKRTIVERLESNESTYAPITRLGESHHCHDTSRQERQCDYAYWSHASTTNASRDSST